MPDHTDAPVTWCTARLVAVGFFFEPLCRLTQLSRVKLVVTRHLLDECIAAVILEDDEVAQECEEAARGADAFQHHLQLGHMRIGQRLSGDRAPGLEPFPPSREGADASLHTVRDDQGRIHRE